MSRTQTARFFTGGFFILTALLVSGCASLHTDRILATAGALPEPVELTAVPFFPQEEYQCGPAALATVLNWSGVSITPAELAPQMYLPERRGSLQLELLGTARRHGRVPYVLQPQLETLLAEVSSGNPVLVLQNLSLPWYPKWHYAVVVGFDLKRDRVILRSGPIERHETPFKVFERTWRRSNYWALVVLSPDRLPFTAEEIPYVQAVAPLERLSRWPETATAYATALTRWPKSLAARMGLGNSRYALGDLRGAEEAFRRATQDHPDAGATFNNLAQTLADQGRLPEAQAAAQRAVELGGPQHKTFRETLKQIETKIENKN
ncbi:hypothetical protein SCL_2565 [Sulfuricaulis limicola]|uniref:Peptidase C39-like domain-containing protein n=1 Tax=Sulfuricaulis limicola TaxID=1620215 RepID=A0A1B4XJ69_9GAMM|nr:PA2778 family cysteine peptidase [Sulfuricaulis limicola]BAV34842.1 hypothetical protein SCL_2565 [Sulfuricaulis limicola]